jgi:hypothetical protein
MTISLGMSLSWHQERSNAVLSFLVTGCADIRSMQTQQYKCTCLFKYNVMVGMCLCRSIGMPILEANAIYNLQVVKEVAVLDNINPGGLYAARVRLLGSFSPTSAVFAGPPALEADDIPDPLYGNTGARTELLRLRNTVQQIRAACKGLLQHLLDLDKRLVIACQFNVEKVHRASAADIIVPK